MIIDAARRKRWLGLIVVNLRFLLGLAFVPAALKKLLGQPFTDPGKTGVFHDFLHAFHATGGMYFVVGALQLIAATLLMTQRLAALGALIALPLFTAIGALCWSTIGAAPTSWMVTLMWLGIVGLLVWDAQRFRGIFVAGTVQVEPLTTVDERRWGWCGAAMLAVYAGSAAAYGGVYRPRGIELDEPAFYVMPVVMLLPLVTYVVDRRRRR